MVHGISDLCSEAQSEYVKLLLPKEENECLCNSSSENPALTEASVVFVH